MPGAEVLRGELVADLLLDVLVDLVGAHVLPAVAVAVGDQVLGAAAPAPHRLDRLAHRPVADRLDAALAALGGEVEDHLAVADRDVFAEQGRDAVALVGFGVELAADPEEAEVEEPHRAGQRPLARHPVARQIPRRRPSQARQGDRELAHRLELARRRPPLPGLVVAVLLAAGGVDPGRLDMAEGVRADPHLLPGRRDRQLADPRQGLLVLHPPAVGVEVAEPLAAPAAGDSRAGAVGAPQPAPRASPAAHRSRFLQRPPG